jgi:hypothetical protein
LFDDLLQFLGDRVFQPIRTAQITDLGRHIAHHDYTEA